MSQGGEAPRRHFVYALRCADGSLYFGYTTDPARRLRRHNAGKGARYTLSRRPVVLLRCWPFPTRSEALRFEARLKRLSKRAKEALLRAESAGSSGC